MKTILAGASTCKSDFRNNARKILSHAFSSSQNSFDSQSVRVCNNLSRLFKNLSLGKDFKRHPLTWNRSSQKNPKKIFARKGILFYAPFGFEANIFKLIFDCKRKKSKVFLPCIQGLSFKMLPFRLPLEKNHYGIYESAKSQFGLAKVDIVVVPVLGIDTNFKRIGFGKGMYDRTFARKPNKRQRSLTVIFVSRIPCVSVPVISQSYDLQGDYFVSATACCKRLGYGNFIASDRVYNLWRYY
ncbi:MAG: 5-formyltetrahydrofolate cyclo-ligase [Helicobacter sp.]|nr:5-formyltetrahydrofolate cyclo-ligase [Helicobacter sp.]